MTAKTPEQIAAEIVNQFAWSSNVMRDGRLVGEQVGVAEAIAGAIKADRAAMASAGWAVRNEVTGAVTRFVKRREVAEANARTLTSNYSAYEPVEVFVRRAWCLPQPSK